MLDLIEPNDNVDSDLGSGGRGLFFSLACSWLLKSSSVKDGMSSRGPIRLGKFGSGGKGFRGTLNVGGAGGVPEG